MIRYNHFIKCFLVLFGLIFVSSCVKDFTINMPSDPKNLVINAVFTVDSIPKIIITKERLITDISTNTTNGNSEAVFIPITNASIILYEDDKILTNTFAYNTSDGYYYNNNIKCKANSKYKIEVSTPSLTSAFTTYQAPEKFNSQLVETRKYSQTQYFPGGIYNNTYQSQTYTNYTNDYDSIIIIKIRIPAFASKKCFVLHSKYSSSSNIVNLGEAPEKINLISPANIKQDNLDFFTEINQSDEAYHVNYPSYPYLIFTNENYLNKEMLVELIFLKTSYSDFIIKKSFLTIDMYQLETKDYIRTLAINSQDINGLILGLSEPSVVKSNTSNGLGYFVIKSINTMTVQY